MTNSVTKIECENCGKPFIGVFRGFFDLSKTYTAACPSCEEQVFFPGGVTLIDEKVPDNAVEIMLASIICGTSDR